MKKKITILLLCMMVLPGGVLAAPCSKINLTKCLDSACAINLSSNPAARCQYCGTADAGEPAADKMRSVTAGTSSKNTISAKELSKAPTDPGERYVWASKRCLSIVPNCTADDITDTYDKLIEKSCEAAGVANDMASLQKKALKNNKNENSCTSEISVCLTKSDKCDSDFSKCSDDKQFDDFFATCSIQATGCDDFVSHVRTTIGKNRDNITKTIKENVNAIVTAHQNARNKKLETIRSNCSTNADYDACVTRACSTNTSNNCGTSAEQTIANNLCQFYKTACTKIK